MRASEIPIIKHEYDVYLIIDRKKYKSNTYPKHWLAMACANRLYKKYGGLGYSTKIETRTIQGVPGGGRNV